MNHLKIVIDEIGQRNEFRWVGKVLQIDTVCKYTRGNIKALEARLIDLHNLERSEMYVLPNKLDELNEEVERALYNYLSSLYSIEQWLKKKFEKDRVDFYATIKQKYLMLPVRCFLTKIRNIMVHDGALPSSVTMDSRYNMKPLLQFSTSNFLDYLNSQIEDQVRRKKPWEYLGIARDYCVSKPNEIMLHHMLIEMDEAQEDFEKWFFEIVLEVYKKDQDAILDFLSKWEWTNQGVKEHIYNLYSPRFENHFGYKESAKSTQIV